MQPKLRPLFDILQAVASERRLRLSVDTHYDAGNFVLSWWHQEIRHRLDFQPLHNQPLQVTYLRDKYPFLPKLLAWCSQCVPMFPVVPSVEWDVLGQLSEPYSRAQLEDLVRDFLPPNHSFKPTPQGGAAQLKR